MPYCYFCSAFVEQDGDYCALCCLEMERMANESFEDREERLMKAKRDAREFLSEENLPF